MTTTSFDPVLQLTSELELPVAGIRAVLALLGEGATVPFIARYRKEATGGLDEVQIRAISERNTYLCELEDRRQSVLKSVAEQGKLTDALEQRILACKSKAELEDLYLPYRPKRRTRATIAREKGLEPLAARIWAQPRDADPLAEAQAFVDPEKSVEDAQQALAGAADIVAERIAEDADIRGVMRTAMNTSGLVEARVLPEKEQERSKFEQYYTFSGSVASIPSHRFLAVRRGEREGFLRVRIEVEEERLVPQIRARTPHDPASRFGPHLEGAVLDAYRRLLLPSIEAEVGADLKMRSDRGAVDVFADNLRHLLLAAPLGEQVVVGIDPGLRTGCKCVAIDATGKFLGNVTLYLSKGERALAQAIETLVAFVRRHPPLVIAVGNGTGGRETEAFVRETLAVHGLKDPIVVQVNEAGASVYSASELSREEFPDLDVTVRGAISIARRLQDPLAELVKIDPKSIGVGQYQHDVHQGLLARKLDEVVESCVNHVGVELNTASSALLSRVAGVGAALAKKIVKHREDNGLFHTRQELLKVTGLGRKTFEQAAGFLRIRGGAHPLDASAVHPERYGLVEQIAKDMSVPLGALVGNEGMADKVNVARYVSAEVGEPTLRDIVGELKKPGRDPRANFEPPKFRDDVHTLEDLRQGMTFEGVVTNVTAFGAFVDIGVHQDGLVHISELADRFVKDPHEVVRAGDKLKVRVLDVDTTRRRISLSARSESSKPERGKSGGAKQDGPRGGGGPGKRQASRFSNNPFANAFKR